MSKPRVSDLHLKKELTQIRKAARILRDPGTTSSWRSPLAAPSSSSRSAAIMASLSSNRKIRNPDKDGRHRTNDKRVFLYNWTNPNKPEEDQEGDEGDETSSFAGDGTSVSDGGLASRRRDTNLAPSSSSSSSPAKRRRGKKSNHKKETILSRKLNPRIDQSDDAAATTDDYCNSEDTRRRVSPALLLLSKVRASKARRDDSSYTYSTPALSTSSFNWRHRNPSTTGSWDGGDDEEADDYLDLPGRRGCGIPCYWSRRASPATAAKHGASCGGCYSPSFSDTLRRKGSSIILCGSRTSVYPRRRRAPFSSSRRRAAVAATTSRSAQGVLPLLTAGGSSIGTDDELSTNFDELDLEGLSRLDGRRWSASCRSRDGLEIVVAALNGEGDEEVELPGNVGSFSHKYRPIFFEELIGQSIVVQSLANSVSRGRISPVYLFQGPRGTGKTSAARIFASSLNCSSASGESRPCGYCRDCAEIASGKSDDFWEVDGTDKRGVDRVRHMMKNISASSSRYRIVVVDECHLLSSKTWLFFLKFLKEPPQRVVFIFITTDLDNVPRAVQSRCQRYLFNKIKEGDIVVRLRKISAEENLDVEQDALDLIALNADGSLRDAETMLEQLSLLGKRISKSLVNELVGIVSDEKLFELLEVAMSSDTAETVKIARELMDSGVDPLVLMCQLASLIMDIIAGTNSIVDDKDNSLFGGRNMTEAELERLKNALKLLSEAEKQLRISSERSTWFTATLLQLGSMCSPDPNHSGSSRIQSYKTTEDDPSTASIEATVYRQKSDIYYLPHKSSSPGKRVKNGITSSLEDLPSQNDGVGTNSKHSHTDGGVSAASCDDVMVGNISIRCVNSDKLDNIWDRCIEKCHSKTLRQLLHTHGRLVSLSDDEGVLIAYVAFSDKNIKIRAERFLSSLTNSMETVLRCNIEVRIILLPGGEIPLNVANPLGTNGENNPVCSTSVAAYSKSHPLPNGTYHSSGSSKLSAEGSVHGSDKVERRNEIPMQRIESIIREQRLETAWLQAVEKGTPGSLNRLRPEKNQILPQEGNENQTDLMGSNEFSSQQWEDELNRELKAFKADTAKAVQKDQLGRRTERYPMSPSLLHDTSVLGSSVKDNLGYESGSGRGGCSGFLCWKSGKSRNLGKVRGTPVQAQKDGRFSLCGKPKKSSSRFRT